MTNRQWLESLSDKEFAQNWLFPKDCRQCGKDEGSCMECTINWLQAEHKE